MIAKNHKGKNFKLINKFVLICYVEFVTLEIYPNLLP